MDAPALGPASRRWRVGRFRKMAHIGIEPTLADPEPDVGAEHFPCNYVVVLNVRIDSQ